MRSQPRGTAQSYRSSQSIGVFQRKVWRHFKESGRAFPWRETKDPYAIFVSELMLQQTQTSRVVEKYREFLKAFPTVKTLAAAPLSQVLKVWQGLGYNRRALFLKRAAEMIVKQHAGKFPSDIEALRALPGVGSYTAAAVLAFAFNKPTVFIETNIRAVFIHEFFPKAKKVSDAEILRLIEMSVSKRKAREWYYALMDYGVVIKASAPELTKRSAHYVKQSPFKGSRREVRGAVLRLLANNEELPLSEVQKIIRDERVVEVIGTLIKEGLICFSKKRQLTLA